MLDACKDLNQALRALFFLRGQVIARHAATASKGFLFMVFSFKPPYVGIINRTTR